MSAIVEFLLARIAEDMVATHIARWDPARVLTECQAKRTIVEWVAAEDDGTSPPQALILGDVVIQCLAVVYADHPDYREEWKP